MRTIKLCHGPGNGINEACLMTASNMIIRDDDEISILSSREELDENDKVCPIIREFIIVSNDSIPINILGELYTPFVWEILGTNTNDINIMIERVRILYNWAIDEYDCDLSHLENFIKERNPDKLISSAELLSGFITKEFLRITNLVDIDENFIMEESQKLVDIMWELISCGDKRPIEQEFILTHDELVDKLELVS